MTDRDAEQEAREIVSLYVHNHGRHGEPLSCPSCKKLCAPSMEAVEGSDGKEWYGDEPSAPAGEDT